EVLFKRRLEGGMHVEIPRLADERRSLSAGFDQMLQVRVLLAGDVLAPGAAERRQLRPQVQLAYALEELDVLAVAARIAAFDIVDAKRIELERDLDFVFRSQADAFALRAVAQGGIENA